MALNGSSDMGLVGQLSRDGREDESMLRGEAKGDKAKSRVRGQKKGFVSSN